MCRVITWASLFLMILLVSCGTPASPPPDAAAPSLATPAGAVPPDTAPIKIGYLNWAGFLPWQVALEADLFAQQGVKVDLVWFEGYGDSINAVNAGQLDGSNMTLSDIITSRAAGSDLVSVLVTDYSAGNDLVIAAENIPDLAALKGQKVAVEFGTVSHFLLLRGLSKAGLSAQDIEIQQLEAGAAAAAFAAGQISAAATYEPYSSQALKVRAGKVLFSSKDFPGAISDHLVFQRSLVEQRPEDVQKIVNAWFAALAYIKQNPDAAYTIMARRAGLSVEEFKAQEDGVKILSHAENLANYAPGEDMMHLSFASREVLTFLHDMKLVQTMPDLSTLFDDRFLKAVPQAS